MVNYKAIAASAKTSTTGLVSMCVTLVIIMLSAFQDYLAGNGIDVAKYLTAENIAIVYGIIIGFQGILSRDADKSSQDSGVRDPLPEQKNGNVSSDTAAAINDAFGDPAK